MKIGLLAYHAACNFGAFLQLLSTVEYIKKQGDEPIVINWIPRGFIEYYRQHSLPKVMEMYSQLRGQYFTLTEQCENDKQVAAIIIKENIEAVIIGSDAVLQHYPLRQRLYFPCRTIIHIYHPSADKIYPNPFWGTFNRYLKKPVPAAVISGSSQDCPYYNIKMLTKRHIKKSILSLRYISVRDDWTRKMIAYLTGDEIIPEVTPDPVFAFNNNALHLLPSKEDILNKFGIPKRYILLSFKNGKSVSQSWIDNFQKKARERGFSCVKLPYSDAAAFGDIQYTVGNILSPLDWFALIKYSEGYVGNNMHPIVSSLANNVPFFSFDNYGISILDGKVTDGESSKIYHILNLSGFLDNRIFVNGSNYREPSAEHVLNSILCFDKNKEKIFAEDYYEHYSQMMGCVYASIKQK